VKGDLLDDSSPNPSRTMHGVRSVFGDSEAEEEVERSIEKGVKGKDKVRELKKDNDRRDEKS